MKRLICFIFALCILHCAPVRAETDYYGGEIYSAAESFAGGAGTEADPYLITTWEEFTLINEYGCGEGGKGVHFKIVAEPENRYFLKSGSRNVRTAAIGTADLPFEGVLDGCGIGIEYYAQSSIMGVIGENGVVRNIASTTGSAIAAENYGLVESCSTAGSDAGGMVIKNYGEIRSCTSSGDTKRADKQGNIGAIASENYGLISGCTAYGEIYGASVTGIGGIAGYNDGGTIENCFNGAVVRGASDSRAVGGIAGDNSRGTIRDCYVCARIQNGGSEAGGICGRLNDGTVERCFVHTAYTENDVYSVFYGSFDKFGGIVGARYGDCVIKDCYFDKWKTLPQVGNSRAEDAVSGQTYNELINFNYDGWDFDNIWIRCGNELPYLRIMPKGAWGVKSHWAGDSVDDLYGSGAMTGYEDGTFRLDNPVTRAEFIKMLAVHKELTLSGEECPYTDLPAWAEDAVAAAYNRGWLDHIGQSDTVLGADGCITRVEAAAISGRADYIPQLAKDITGFADYGEIPEWAREPLSVTYGRKITVGYPDGTFRPYAALTRAEAARIISLTHVRED